MQKE
ncbi:098f7914-4da0-44fe-9a9c-bcd470c6ae98 [Thermothielavioides terrestris]|jgi:uncharacterized protein with ACT and thioredoxin-like domain